MTSRSEKERRKKLLAPMMEEQRAEERRRVRPELGDDFADVAEALEPLWPAYEREPTSLTPLQQALLDWHVLSGLVGNGGFDLWIRSNGHRAASTARSLRDHGVEQVAAAVEEAVRLAGVADGMDSDELNAVMDAVTDNEARYDAIDRLSEVVWAADDDLLQRAVKLVRTNRDQFTP